MNRYVLAAVFLAVVVIAAGCGGGEQAPQPIEILETTFAHGLTEKMEPVDPGKEFRPDEPVHFSVKLKGTPKEGVVSARFLYREQQIAETSVDLAQARAEQGLIFVLGGNTFVGFSLTHDEPLPISEAYRVEVSVGGRPVGTHAFAVVPPADAVPSRLLKAALARGATEDYQPIDPSDMFEPGDAVYLVGQMDMGTLSNITVNWYVAGTLDEEGTRSLTAQKNLRDTGFYFNFVPKGGWPEGQHRAVLLIDDQEVGRYAFSVSKVVAVAPTATPEPLPTPTPKPVPTPEPVVPGAVSTLRDVKSAAIQIEAVGSFVHPQVGQVLNAAGAGSGFIIDPSGIAVTNNHVVTGAALLRVWVGGEAKPRNAKILGVSECSDLAVIDIEGEGYPFLEWYEGDITVGLPIYAAGFPLGDPEYTLLQGIVSKERANGETNWASVDYVIEHTALTNPGNSGGPVVTEDGKVVAVHYAGDPDTEQHFAIARDEALPIIEQLRPGRDVDSIGLNGEAVNTGEGLSGMWVASVKSGSPADKAGVKGGDIVTKLEGLVLATDGTMADYCDILRTHSPEDTLNIEVLRFATEEVLEGQLNGRALEPSFSFAQQIEETEGGTSTTYSGYTTVTDDSEVLKMDIPVEWGDVSGSPWEIDGQVVGAKIVAAANREDWYQTWSEPGVFFGASRALAQTHDEVAILDRDDFSNDCDYEGRLEYQDPLYTGLYDYYTNCGGLGTIFINLAAVPKSRAFVILVQIQVVSEADLEALDRIIDTFQVIGDLPSQ